MLAISALALVAPVAFTYAAPTSSLLRRDQVNQYETWLIKTDGATFGYYTKDKE